MKRTASYNTKQREAILSYIASRSGEHVTAGQIADHFRSKGAPIGPATIYRQLDKLTANGKLRKLSIDGISGACYQYAGNEDGFQPRLHLKCEDCGRLLRLHCDMMDEIQQHISSAHAFHVNSIKTVLYGKCDGCLRRI